MFYQLILLFLLGTSNLTWGNGTIALIDDQNNVFNIAKSGTYFIDESQALSFNTISSDEYSKRFLPINRDYLQLGLVKGNIWIRSDIAIQTTGNMPTVLEIRAPMLQYLDIYLPTFYGNQIQAELGSARPYSNKTIQAPNYLFTIPANMPSVFTVYLKLSSHLPINAQIELKTLSQMAIDTQERLTLTGILIGILLTLFISNILFFIKYSHPMFVIYACLLVGIVVLHLAFHDQVSQFFPNIIGIQERIYNFASLLCLCAIVFFSRLYLNTRRHLPKIDTLLIIIGVLNLLFAVIFTLTPEAIHITVLPIMVVTTLTFLTINAIIAFIKDIPFSGYYLTARLTLFTGHSAWIMSVYGIIPSTTLLEWGFTLTIITEALIHFMGMIVQTTPFLQKYSHKTEYSQRETFDLLSDLSSRIRRQINVIGGALPLLEKTPKSSEREVLLTSSQTANNNLKSLLERVNYLSDIKDNLSIEQTDPMHLNQLIDNAYANFQQLDQDNTIIELSFEKTDHVEVLQDVKTLQHLIEVLMQEFKHFTNQPLTLNTVYHEANREGTSLLELNCYPLPKQAHANTASFDFGMHYITLLVEYLKGKIHLSDNDQEKSLNIRIPIHSHIRPSANEMDQQDHFDLIFLGQEDNDLQRAFTILQSHANKIEHFSTLESVLEYLEHPEERKSGSIILVFDNGGHIPHITQQRILPLMRAEDQCLLISNNVKMSLDYAKKLGFDDILACSDLESQLTQQLSRLIQKGDRIKHTPLSRIKLLRKTP